MSVKSFLLDFKKHFNQAFATLAAGIIIGWLFGGAKVINKQQEQGKALDTLQYTVNSLIVEERSIMQVNTKLDSIISIEKRTHDKLLIQEQIDKELFKNIEEIRRYSEETNKRLFEISKAK